MSWDYHKYLHIYAQHTHHQESFIVGNKEALLELRNLIDHALKEGEAKGVFFPSDEEGYPLYVSLVDNEDSFLSLEMPYTEQFGDYNQSFHFINTKNDPNAPYSPATLLKQDEKGEE